MWLCFVKILLNVVKLLLENGADFNKKDKFLDFLAIESREMADKTLEMNLIFSGNSVIKILTEVIEVTLDDQGDAWETKSKPKHNLYGD